LATTNRRFLQALSDFFSTLHSMEATRCLPAVILLSLLLIAATAGAQLKLQEAPGAHVTSITPPGQTGDEEVIAVNRYKPNQVVMAYGGNEGGMAAYSFDSGQTWALVNPAGEGQMGGNKSITFDDRGNVFLAYQLIEKLGSPGYWGHNANGKGKRNAHRTAGYKTAVVANPPAKSNYEGDNYLEEDIQ